jgi:carbonic anhydrase/acetyltransferase-like protein (isoleucine patch superfamily)
LIAGAGSSNAPSYTFSGNTSVGMFSPATNALGLTSAGVERMRISANGFVGNNTITPGYTLDVNGNTNLGGGNLTVGGMATITGATTISNTATVTSNLTVSGATTISNTATITGATTISNTATITGATTISNNATITSNLTVSNTILNANGTDLLPAYSFASDPNTGMFRIDEDLLGFSTGGVRRM